MLDMRFCKTVMGILLVTVFALFYAHQEIELVKTGFLINKHRQELSLLLDQYRSLVYNLSRLESPARIEETLCVNEITLCTPKKKDIRHFSRINLAYQSEGKEEKAKESFLQGVLDRFSSKAEAKVVSAH